MDSTRAAVRSLTGERDARSIEEVGRRARLDLRFAVPDDHTVLAHAYAEPPFRVGRGFPDGDGMHMIHAWSAPGIFGGDRLQQTISVERGARVRLTSQSALQVHPSADQSSAMLDSVYRVERGGHLHCEWSPVIPFAEARLDQRIEIDLEEGATLFWSDAVMSGREACGERWKFARLAHQLRCSRDGVLAYLERYRLEPVEDQLDRRWIADDACYFGSILVVHPEADRRTAERLHHDINSIEGVHGAADVLEDGVLLARLMSASGPPFHQARALLDALRDQRVSPLR